MICKARMKVSGIFIKMRSIIQYAID